MSALPHWQHEILNIFGQTSTSHHWEEQDIPSAVTPQPSTFGWWWDAWHSSQWLLFYWEGGLPAVLPTSTCMKWPPIHGQLAHWEWATPKLILSCCPCSCHPLSLFALLSVPCHTTIHFLLLFHSFGFLFHQGHLTINLISHLLCWASGGGATNNHSHALYMGISYSH